MEVVRMFGRNKWAFFSKRRIYRKEQRISVDKERKKKIICKLSDYITYFIRKEERNERQC
jgi:hypothetical protein